MQSPGATTVLGLTVEREKETKNSPWFSGWTPLQWFSVRTLDCQGFFRPWWKRLSLHAAQSPGLCQGLSGVKI